jgi:hypothetical protein
MGMGYSETLEHHRGLIEGSDCWLNQFRRPGFARSKERHLPWRSLPSVSRRSNSTMFIRHPSHIADVLSFPSLSTADGMRD